MQGKQAIDLALKVGPLVLLWQLGLCMHCNEAVINGYCAAIVLPMARERDAKDEQAAIICLSLTDATLMSL